MLLKAGVLWRPIHIKRLRAWMKRHYCASDVDSLKVYKPEIHAEVQDKLISSSSMLMGLINTTTCLQGENSVMVKF